MSRRADEVFAEYIAARKVDELDRRKRVEDRGAAIVTTSSSLLTLVFLLTVFVTGSDKDAAKLVSRTAGSFLLVALACFVIAVVIGIAVQHTMWKSKRVALSTLQNMFDGTSDWHGDADEALRVCAFLDYEVLKSISEGTALKAKLILIALGFQGVAVLLLLCSLGIEFHARGWY